jgi:heme exporter protein D
MSFVFVALTFCFFFLADIIVKKVKAHKTLLRSMFKTDPIAERSISL